MGRETSLGGSLSLKALKQEGMGQVTLITAATIMSRCSCQALCGLSSCITSFQPLEGEHQHPQTRKQGQKLETWDHKLGSQTLNELIGQ